MAEGDGIKYGIRFQDAVQADLVKKQFGVALDDMKGKVAKQSIIPKLVSEYNMNTSRTFMKVYNYNDFVAQEKAEGAETDKQYLNAFDVTSLNLKNFEVAYAVSKEAVLNDDQPFNQNQKMADAFVRKMDAQACLAVHAITVHNVGTAWTTQTDANVLLDLQTAIAAVESNGGKPNAITLDLQQRLRLGKIAWGQYGYTKAENFLKDFWGLEIVDVGLIQYLKNDNTYQSLFNPSGNIVVYEKSPEFAIFVNQEVEVDADYDMAKQLYMFYMRKRFLTKVINELKGYRLGNIGM